MRRRLSSWVSCVLMVCATAARADFIDFRVEEMQPNIAYGGRVSSIAVHPSNDQIVIVASESGGLFRSTDRGKTWKHVDGLPEFSTNDVAFVPANPNIVIATTGDDFRTSGGGGVWRSTDAGITWQQTPAPARPNNFGVRYSAAAISIAPDSGRIFVANGWGVAFSDNQGQTWTNSVVINSSRPWMFSVLARRGGLVVAGGPDGVRRSTDNGQTWTQPANGPAWLWSFHALAGSPFENDHLYAADNDRKLWFSEDRGDHWTQITSAPKAVQAGGGPIFVKASGRTVTSRGIARRVVTLWFGNTLALYTLDASAISGTTSYDYSGAWAGRAIDHADPRDLAFDNARRPFLLGTDGGLHRTLDGGLTWQITGGGKNGYNALQITETKGQWIAQPSRYDLYFGTQDNAIWASSTNGVTWSNRADAEGFFLEREPRVATAADSRITFVSCFPCGNRVSDALLANVADWNNAQAGTGVPTVLSKDLYVQAVMKDMTFKAGLAVTANAGTKWSGFVGFSETALDLPKLSQPGATPVLYQSLRMGFDMQRNFAIARLARIVKDATTNTGTISYPANTNFGGLGITPTMFAWYQVFAVDPKNANHVIAPDVVNQRMMETTDGGNTWTAMNELTKLVTGNGAFMFNTGENPHASALSFSRDTPDHVAVGTSQNGLLVSGDRGKTWTKVPGSELATYITSIEWRTASEAIVSTYGRGLWRFRWKVVRPAFEFDPLCKLPCNIRLFPPHIDPVPWTNAVLAFNGNLQGVRMNARGLQELFVSPGASVVFFGNAEDAARVTVTETTQTTGLHGATPLARRGDGLLVGATFSGGKMISGAYAPAPMPMYVPTAVEMNPEPRVGSVESPAAGKPYIELGVSSPANIITAGDVLAVRGRNFVPQMTLELAIDERPAGEVVMVDSDGTFATRLRAPMEVGLHHVTVRAQGRFLIDGASFLVHHAEAAPAR